MSREQVKWYLAQYKAFTKLKEASLKSGEPSDPELYALLRQRINKACAKLGIGLKTVVREVSTMHSTSTNMLFFRAELKEYERRLTAIPEKMAA